MSTDKGPQLCAKKGSPFAKFGKNNEVYRAADYRVEYPVYRAIGATTAKVAAFLALSREVRGTDEKGFSLLTADYGRGLLTDKATRRFVDIIRVTWPLLVQGRVVSLSTGGLGVAASVYDFFKAKGLSEGLRTILSKRELAAWNGRSGGILMAEKGSVYVSFLNQAVNFVSASASEVWWTAFTTELDGVDDFILYTKIHPEKFYAEKDRSLRIAKSEEDYSKNETLKKLKSWSEFLSKVEVYTQFSCHAFDVFFSNMGGVKNEQSISTTTTIEPALVTQEGTSITTTIETLPKGLLYFGVEYKKDAKGVFGPQVVQLRMPVLSTVDSCLERVVMDNHHRNLDYYTGTRKYDASVNIAHFVPLAKRTDRMFSYEYEIAEDERDFLPMEDGDAKVAVIDKKEALREIPQQLDLRVPVATGLPAPAPPSDFEVMGNAPNVEKDEGFNVNDFM
jgi:hypothetical protein